MDHPKTEAERDDRVCQKKPLHPLIPGIDELINDLQSRDTDVRRHARELIANDLGAAIYAVEVLQIKLASDSSVPELCCAILGLMEVAPPGVLVKCLRHLMTKRRDAKLHELIDLVLTQMQESDKDPIGPEWSWLDDPSESHGGVMLETHLDSQNVLKQAFLRDLPQLLDSHRNMYVAYILDEEDNPQQLAINDELVEIKKKCYSLHLHPDRFLVEMIVPEEGGRILVDTF